VCHGEETLDKKRLGELGEGSFIVMNTTKQEIVVFATSKERAGTGNISGSHTMLQTPQLQYQ
jgi:hypothetical protein